MSSMWLRETINDSQTNKASAKRVAMLLATGSLSMSVIALSVAAIAGYDVAASLGAVSVPLAGLGGYSYVNGKNAETNKILKEKQP